MAKKIETDIQTVDIDVLENSSVDKMQDEDENNSESKITDNLADFILRQTIVNPDNEISKAEFDTLDKSKYKTKSVTELEENKEQFDVGLDILKYSAVDMMLDENDNQPETKITYNLDDIVDNVA